MPCLTGFISKQSHNQNLTILDKMVKSLHNESFYSQGTFFEKDLNVYIGWSVHKDSFSDCMPVVNEKNDIFLFINGEVFIDNNLINDLKKKGHDFKGDNASYLVHLYEENKDDFFLKLNGQYSGILIDKRKNLFFIFNDRLGINRIFTFENKEGFFFSNEAKTILAAAAETRDFDPVGLVEFLSCECTLGEQSLYTGIKILPGGTLIEIDKDLKYKRKIYFDKKEWENQPQLSSEEFSDNYIKKFGEIINRYTLPKGKIGISMTGGIDSRMVISMANPAMESIPCYTFGSIHKDSYDVKIAKRVAKAIKQKFNIIKVDKNFTNDITKFFEKSIYISDGYIGLAGAVELYVNFTARKIAPIRLTGNYGSELLRKIRTFKFNIPRGNFFNSDINELLNKRYIDFNDYINNLKSQTYILYQQAPHQGYGRRAVENSQVESRTPFLDNELIKILYQSPDNLDGFKLSKKVVDINIPRLTKIATDRGYWGNSNPIISKIRHYSRQLSFKLEYLIGRGAPDIVVKLHLLMKLLLLEKIFIYTHKFYDERIMIRDHMEKYFKELLLNNGNLKIYSFIDKKKVENLIIKNFKQQNNFSQEINKIAALAAVEKLFF